MVLIHFLLSLGSIIGGQGKGVTSQVPIVFKSSTYTVIIANLDCDFFIKTDKQIGLFGLSSFNKYPLRPLYHIRLDCFNPYICRPVDVLACHARRDMT